MKTETIETSCDYCGHYIGPPPDGLHDVTLNGVKGLDFCNTNCLGKFVENGMKPIKI